MLFLFAIAIQIHLQLNGDVGYLMLISEQFLHGQKYGTEIFETNPPMILYLYYPVNVIRHLFSLSPQSALLISMFTLIGANLLLCNNLLARILPSNPARTFLLCAILFATAILPSGELGQRENIALILTLPYFISAALQLEKKPLSMLLSCCIGLMAGLGFGIKPYFLFPLVLTELTLMIREKNNFAWLRIPPIIAGSIMTLYLITTYLITPGYFTDLLPLLVTFYFPGIKQPWSEIFTSFAFIFCSFTLVLSLVYSRIIRCQSLILIFAVALGGFILSFLITRTTWYLHVLPALGTACILTALFLIDLSASQLENITHATEIRRTRLWLAPAFIALIISPLYFAVGVTFYYLNYPNHKAYITLLNRIITTKSAGPRTISCFSPGTTNECFPLVYDAQAIYASRYPFFWWLRGAIKLKKDQPATFLAHRKDIEKFIRDATDDIEKYKTEWIIVNSPNTTIAMKGPFNYAGFMSAYYPAFLTTWKHYHLEASIPPWQLYRRNGEAATL